MKRISKLRPAIAAFLLLIAMPTYTTAISFMNQPVSDQLQVGMGSVSLYYSLMVAVAIFATPFVGQWIHKLGVPRIVLLAAVWGTGCMFLFSVSRALWMFYAVGILAGVLGGTAIYLTANVALQVYYTTAEAAGLIGFVMAGSGIGSMLYSNVLPVLLEKVGVAVTYRAIGAIWFTLLVLAVLILGKARPVTAEHIEKTGGDGMTRKEALCSPVFYMMIGAVLLMAVGTCLIQHWPPLVAEMGYDATAVGAIVSFYSAVLTAGKIAQGVLYSRVGIVKGAVAMHALYVLGFILLLEPRFVYPAFFCIGLGFGIPTTLTPVLSKELFGPKEFAAIYSILTMSMSIGSFIATPAWGVVYDTLGSYRPGFVPMAVTGVLALLLQVGALRLQRRGKT